MTKSFSILFPLLAAVQVSDGLKLVSQTFDGKGEMRFGDLPSSPTTMSLMMDVDAVKYRFHHTASIDITKFSIDSMPKWLQSILSLVPITTLLNVQVSVIFDAHMKRLTLFADHKVEWAALHVFSGTMHEKCVVGKFHTFLEPRFARVLIQKVFSNSKPVDSTEAETVGSWFGGSNTESLDRYETATGSFYMDKENILKKIVIEGDVSLPGVVAKRKLFAELKDPNATHVTPSADVFKPRADWDTCTEIQMLPLPNTIDHMPGVQNLLADLIGSEHVSHEMPMNPLMGLPNLQGWHNPQVMFLSCLAMGCLAFAAVLLLFRPTSRALRAAYGTARTGRVTPFLAENAVEMEPVQSA